MIFSILLPTRLRPQRLNYFIQSIIETTYNINNIEICLIIDEDDNNVPIINQISKRKKDIIYKNDNLIKIFKRNRGNSLVLDYYNWGAINCCEGEFIIVCNDDCLFEINDWDKFSIIKIEEFLKNKKDRIFLGVPNDGESLNYRSGFSYPISNFPIISQEGIKHFGYFFNPEFKDAGAEPDIIKKYWELDSVLNLREEIMIKHNPLWFNYLPKEYETH